MERVPDWKHSRMRLPTPGAHGLPDDATIVVPVSDPLTLYRLLAGAQPRVEDFKQGWTRAQARLRGILELFRVAVSHWLERDQAVAESVRRPCFVARLELVPDPRVRVALTEGEDRGHVDVWAHPRDVLDSVLDVAAGARPS